MQHTVTALVEDKPGVLNRVVSLFRKRNFNIDSLTVSKTESPGRSRMTIVFDNTQENVNRLMAYLQKLINVIQVEDLTFTPMVSRDLAMIKVKASSTSRTEIMQFVDTFRARIIDVARDSLVIEVTGTHDKIESFVEMMLPYGILEMVRSGAVAMSRGQSSFSSGDLSQAVPERKTLEPAYVSA
jgi:acetolactate synthase-1/3 small subunit